MFRAEGVARGSGPGVGEEMGSPFVQLLGYVVLVAILLAAGFGALGTGGF